MGTRSVAQNPWVSGCRFVPVPIWVQVLRVQVQVGPCQPMPYPCATLILPMCIVFRSPSWFFSWGCHMRLYPALFHSLCTAVRLGSCRHLPIILRWLPPLCRDSCRHRFQGVGVCARGPRRAFHCTGEGRAARCCTRKRVTVVIARFRRCG